MKVNKLSSNLAVSQLYYLIYFSFDSWLAKVLIFITIIDRKLKFVYGAVNLRVFIEIITNNLFKGYA